MYLASGDPLPLGPAPKLERKSNPNEMVYIDEKSHEMALRFMKKKAPDKTIKAVNP